MVQLEMKRALNLRHFHSLNEAHSKTDRDNLRRDRVNDENKPASTTL